MNQEASEYKYRFEKLQDDVHNQLIHSTVDGKQIL